MGCVDLGRCLLTFRTMTAFYDEFNLGHSTYLINHFKAQNSKDQCFTKNIILSIYGFQNFNEDPPKQKSIAVL